MAHDFTASSKEFRRAGIGSIEWRELRGDGGSRVVGDESRQYRGVYHGSRAHFHDLKPPLRTPAVRCAQADSENPGGFGEWNELI